MVALDHIRTAEDLQQFLHHEVAATLASVELPLLYHGWLATTAEDDGLLQLLDQTSEAVRFAAEQRQASRRLGTQRWSLFTRLQTSVLDRRGTCNGWTVLGPGCRTSTFVSWPASKLECSICHPQQR